MSAAPGPIWMWLRHSVDVTVTEEAHWKLWFNDSLWRRLQAVFSAFDTTQAFKSTNWSVNVSFLLHLFCLFLSCYWNELFGSAINLSVKFTEHFDKKATSQENQNWNICLKKKRQKRHFSPEQYLWWYRNGSWWSYGCCDNDNKKKYDITLYYQQDI